MSLKYSYSFIAPVYDAIVANATMGMRKQSLSLIEPRTDDNILLCGIGTGLDIPLLDRNAKYTGIDFNQSMLNKAHRRNHADQVQLMHGNVLDLPFAPEYFDIVIMHLILAVVPTPDKALQEASRVLKPGGKILILDKFLQPGQRAPLRKLLNSFLRHIATRTDVIFEEVIQTTPELTLISNTPAGINGWFRHILLEK